MIGTQTLSIALLGNPNSGKSTVFNQLTGLNQKTGNFPGVTVDKKSGTVKLNDGLSIKFTDFPGAYSFFPTSKDERVVLNVLTNPGDKDFPDAILYVADAVQLEKHLLLLTQLKDLGFKVILAINRIDLSRERNIQINIESIEKNLQVPTLEISGRFGDNFENLIQKIEQLVHEDTGLISNREHSPLYGFSKIEEKVSDRIGSLLGTNGLYRNLLLAHHYKNLPYLDEDQKTAIGNICQEEGFEDLKLQVREVMSRYDHNLAFLQKAVRFPEPKKSGITDRIDNVVTHRVWGPLLFVLIMLLVFQAIFAWAETPMDWIDSGFAWISDVIRQILPDIWITDLLTDGILAGLAGILVFIPQIAILFFLISLLEEVGYMARAVFIFDRIMKFFGLNGRSIVALISGGACAIPAVMSTRTISNWKERLITILVTPFISCSARIPVYAVLIGFVVPSITVWGIFNAQGLAFMGLYALGIIAALLAAWVFKLILKSNEPSYLALELPEYSAPSWRNVLLTVKDKVLDFIIEAGKIIMIISVILWALASYGPAESMQNALVKTQQQAQQDGLSEEDSAELLAANRLEASYAGKLGKFIEPAILPLGLDWKMGIALITSFAAREVFVGTMATIYAVGSTDDEASVRARMAAERHPETGLPVYTMATSLSLLIFYVFAMQCMSTLAVVKRETGSWKWPVIQFFFMGGLAYLASFIVFQIFK